VFGGLQYHQTVYNEHQQQRNGNEIMSDKILATVDDVVWTVDNEGTHTITYGCLKNTFPKSLSINAAEHFGCCVHHQIECEGYLMAG
jgi:hypothetical protein